MKIIAIFVAVAAIVSTVEGLRSNGANVCSRNAPYVQSYTERYNQQYPVIKYESCWDWTQGFRCPVNRIQYRTAYRVAYRTVNRKQYYCCTGWSAVGDQCTRAICSSACENDGKCTRPNYCECKSGYSGSTCRNDVNECLTNNGGCEQTCVNLFGSYQCSCVDGYVLRGDKKTCSDHDECVTSTHNCHQKCVNTVGSFACSCEDGYELLADHINCRNIDNCASNPCSHLCSDNLNSYNCSCYYGYSLTEDGISCNPVCKQGCGNGGFCARPGTCECAEGWDGNSCAIPQCSSCVHGECLQPEVCVCGDGWQGSGCSVDINECSVNNGGCDSICLNVEGSYDCSCEPGYVLSGNRHSCTDHDECTSDNHGCQYCVNTKGSYQCVCPDGFDLVDGTDCVDINECTSNPCDHNCINEEGSFHCTCMRGYVLDANARDCSDVDECALNKHECSQICVNTDSWYKCSCEDGYKLDSDGITCLDIDECQTDANDCHQECINVAGSFRCVCYTGFIETELGCEAVCLPMCANNGFCGSPGNCSCEKGWTGSSCEQDVDECSEGSHKCEETCTNVDGGYLCSCQYGFHLVAGHACEDIDECAMNSTNRCTSGCVNTIGNHYCTCEPGFTLDTNGLSCSDHNECELDQHDCDYCANTQGSFSCYCPDGYAMQSDGKSCKPVCDSCTNGVCESPENCVCDEGWKGHGCNWEVTHNHWTVKPMGCRCYFDNSRTDCACCSYGGCQCTSAQPNLCVQCGNGSNCALEQNLNGIDGWTTSATGCPCLDSNGDIDLSRINECACCQNGGCPCGVKNEGKCMQCGLPYMCELKIPWE